MTGPREGMHRVSGTWISCCETGETDCPCTCHPAGPTFADKVLALAFPPNYEVVHGCPPGGSGLTPCCGRTPFELPPTDRITRDPDHVNCQPKPSPAGPPRSTT